MEPIYVIGYARVSTPGQAVFGDSHEEQEKDIRDYCSERGYTLFPDNKVFREAFSGKVTSRPKYDEIIRLIQKNPKKIKFFIIRLIGRMTRGEVENYYAIKKQLKSYGVELRDVGGVIQAEINHFEKYGLQYEWSSESPSETSELMEVKRNQIDRKKVLRQLIEPEIALTRAGFHIGPADDGYLSKRIQVDMKKRFILEPDEVRSKYYIEMFNLRAEGIHSDEEIVKRVNAMGFRTRDQQRWNNDKTVVIGRKKGIPLTIKSLQRIIKRVCYSGVICEKWTNYRPIKAKWSGLVSIETFNRANRGKIFIEEFPNNQLTISYDINITKKLDRRQKFRKDQPFKNVTLCPHCGSPLLASGSTGKTKKKFTAYHCTRKHPRYAIRQNILEKAYNDYLMNIRFTDKFVSTLEKVLLLKYRKEEGTVADRTNLVSKKVMMLKEQKQIKLRAIEATTSVIVKSDLEAEYEDLHQQIQIAQAERNRLEVTEDEIHDFIKHARRLMEHPTEILANPSNKQEQIALFSLFFEKFPTYEEIVSGTPKLTPIFKLFDENGDDESKLVTLPGVEPGFRA
jgi:site-specific DNA recombinase